MGVINVITKQNSYCRKFLSGFLALVFVFSGILSSMGCATTHNGTAKADYSRMLDSQSRKTVLEDSESSRNRLPEMTTVDYEQTGDTHLKQGSLETAFIFYDKALRMDRKNPRLHYKIGRLFLRKRMTAEARKEFEWILKKDQENALALEGLGRIYFMEGNFEEAETHFRSALMKKPDLWEAHNFLGLIYDSRNNHEEAIKHYRNALWAKPKEPSSINNLALSYYLNGQYKEAIRTFETSIRNRSMNQRSYNNYALTLGATGEYDQALEMLKKSGDEAKAYNNLGMIFMKAGEHHRAREAFARAIDLSPTYFAKAYTNMKIVNDGIQQKKRSKIQDIRQLEAARTAAALKESAESHEVNQEIIVEDVVPQEKAVETVVDDMKMISDSIEESNVPAADAVIVDVPTKTDASDLEESDAVFATEESDPEEVVQQAVPVQTEKQVDESGGMGKELLRGARVSLAKAPLYDPSYIKISYPGGDPGWERGANTDLVVRSFRHAGIDLQLKVHEDILENIGFYGIDKRNTSTDHRRVKHLAVFFGRHAVTMGTDKDADWQSGDIVIWDLNGRSKPTHIGIVSDQMGPQGAPLVIHHRRKVDVFTGYPSEDDVLFAWPVVAHFRWQESGVIVQDELSSLNTEARPVQVKEVKVEETVQAEPAVLLETVTEGTDLKAAPVKEVGAAVAAPVLQETAEKVIESVLTGEATPVAETLVAGARLSVAKAPPYNASYKKIPYPGGDPGWKRGGNSDLVVRAFRQAGFDLQQLIHEDIPEDPEAYKIEKRDPSADHRNVQALYTFFSRKADSLGIDGTADWQPGDIVVWDLKGKEQPSHIGIVSDKTDPEGDPLVIHHRKKFGPSACYPSENSLLFEWPIIGHYRWTGK